MNENKVKLVVNHIITLFLMFSLSYFSYCLLPISQISSMTLAPSTALHYHPQIFLILAYLVADHKHQNFCGFGKAEVMSSGTLNAYDETRDFVRMTSLQGSTHAAVLGFVLIRSAFSLLKTEFQLFKEEK